MTQMHNPPHPGRILKEEFEGRSITHVAKHLGVSRVTLSRVLNCQAGVTAEMSLRLSEALDTSPAMWFQMQNAYDFAQAAKKKRKKVAPMKQTSEFRELWQAEQAGEL